ncbi:hypothetical protein Glove_99g70 [Diversispora epigaea]|uniref:G-protein coupled receptors family 1 profile domain-containing protein n=1 Tax=Diversispora epigaea TaxID=1348612 RepID=A0A397J6F4_9GLOM|nr:hypothetical protein Glove_99g70 [Diversispora epigaea]
MSIAEIVAFSATAIIAVVCTVAIGYQTYLIPNKLRITCLFCIPLLISSLILAFTRTFLNSPELKWYTNSYLLIKSIYSSALILCIIDIGKSKFYPQNHYNTTLYKLAIIFLLAGNLCCIISIVLIMLESNQLFKTLGFITTTFLFVASGCFSFTYSFEPIFSTIKNKNNNNNNNNNRNNHKKRLNPTVAAIGIYYMTALGIVAMFSIPFYLIINLLGGPGGYYWQIGAYIDVILRYSVIMAVGMPPSKNLIQFIKRKSFGMTTLDISTIERDVIRCGCVIGGVDSGIWHMNDLDN